ncbi:PAS domain-containing protein [Fodinicurvata halophila]|uniref:PAS domain-containing protein n=1 Tax=Fodinicurvata halophila TaxID=1419723 RepID=A0ABV8UH19_9PROT
MGITTALSEVHSVRVRRVHDYWNTLRGERFAPGRAEIDPAELSDLLPSLLIVDIEAEPFRVRYRLVGTLVVEVSGFDFTGHYLDELEFVSGDGEFQEAYYVVWKEQVPVYARPYWPFDTERKTCYDLGIFPLSDDGENVTRALAVEGYEEIENNPHVQQRSYGWRHRRSLI